MGTTFTGDDGTVHPGSVIKREWVLNGVLINGQTTNTYVGDGTGDLVYRVTASSFGGDTVGESPPVTVTSIPSKLNPPEWQTLPGLLGTFAEDTSVSIPVQATDDDNNISIYEITDGELPPGLSINMFSGVISGHIAEVTEDTTFTFTVKVTDRTDLTLTGEFSINVVNVKTTVTWNTESGTVSDIAPGVPINVSLGAQSV